MKKSIFIIFLTFLLSFSCFLPANAQNTLNSSQIEQYLSSLVRIKTLIINIENETSSTEKESIILQNSSFEASKTPITDTLKQIKNHSSFKNFETSVLSSGFSSIEQWADVGDKIMMAYSAFQLQKSSDEQSQNLNEIKADLNDQLQKIKNNKFISPNQKTILTEKIQNSIALLNDPNYIDNENIKIISPFIARLNSVFKEHQ
ncbi:MAG: hypothetical protein P8J14_05195 [Emcibacteraceae bacterium]|nr:hypothetical protein [Emcibacteraceae bacterium]